MALIGSHFKIDLMLACIGDHFTMGPDARRRGGQARQGEAVVPMHFGTFPVLTGTPDAFGKALKKTAPGTKLTVMEVGKSISCKLVGAHRHRRALAAGAAHGARRRGGRCRPHTCCSGCGAVARPPRSPGSSSR